MSGGWVVSAEWDDSRPTLHGPFSTIAEGEAWITEHLDHECECDECTTPGSGPNVGSRIIRLRPISLSRKAKTMSVELLAERDALAARVAQLEAEITALRKPAPRKRAAARPGTEPCQYCNDTKTPKLTFLGLPLCAGTAQGGDGKCGSRIRSMAKNGRAHEAYAYDGRYSVRPEDGEWVARLDGQVITTGTDRGAVRRFASDHKRTERLAA